MPSSSRLAPVSRRSVAENGLYVFFYAPGVVHQEGKSAERLRCLGEETLDDRLFHGVCLPRNGASLPLSGPHEPIEEAFELSPLDQLHHDVVLVVVLDRLERNGG